MKKVLIYASVASMIQQFNMDNIQTLLDLGCKVEVAANFKQGNTIDDNEIKKLLSTLNNLNVECHDVPVPRSLFATSDIFRSFLITRELINRNQYKIIHCHSPIGGLICRLSNKTSKNYFYSKMIYTAHGFHFYKGNKKTLNFIFSSIEKFCAHFTDILITINKEDFEAAEKFKLKKNGNVLYIPGIGIKPEKILSENSIRDELITSYSLPTDSKILLSVGELNENKNHLSIISQMCKLPSNYIYLICGKGPLERKITDIILEKELQNRVFLLGYRKDIFSLLNSVDIFIFPSKREGLSVALMEAITANLPIIASNIRGNVDIVTNGENGFLYNEDELDNFSELVLNVKQLVNLVNYNKNILDVVNSENIQKRFLNIYKQCLEGEF